MSIEQVNALKVKIFDLSEALEGRHQFESQFFNTLADLMDIPAEQRTDPQVYINAIVALKEKVPVEKEAEAE